jgi:glutaminyl-peptide cyclotransferase
MTKKTAATLFTSLFVLVAIVWLTSFDLAFGKQQVADPDKSEPTGIYKLPLPKVKEINVQITADNFDTDLKNIAVVRVPDTPEHTVVHNYIVSELHKTYFKVHLDSFEQNTVIGTKRFTNIIATYPEEPVEHYLVLSAHYDSKLFKDFVFVAATDSAVPCVMLLDIARHLDVTATLKPGYGIKLIFFDGEEAFKMWTKTDSLYGSRHLADKMDKTPGVNGKTELENIELFVLLDLVGAPSATFHSFFAKTDDKFDLLVAVEQRLRKLKMVTTPGTFFKSQRLHHYPIEDDHVPFLQRGVPIVHLIVTPFPPQWHRASDDLKHLDLPAVLDIQKILHVFVAEYVFSS